VREMAYIYMAWRDSEAAFERGSHFVARSSLDCMFIHREADNAILGKQSNELNF